MPTVGVVNWLRFLKRGEALPIGRSRFEATRDQILSEAPAQIAEGACTVGSQICIDRRSVIGISVIA